MVDIQVVCESVSPENTDLPCPLDWEAFEIKISGVLMVQNWKLVIKPVMLRLATLDSAGSEEI